MNPQILRPSSRSLLLLAIAATLLAITALVLAGWSAMAPVSQAAPKVAPPAAAESPWIDTNPAHAHPVALALPPGAIGRLSIPAIGVDAVARPVGLLPSGAMDVTSDIWEVGVFDQTVAPGQAGSAIIEGHLDWYTGPAVFWNLRALQNGDEIDYTSADGRVHRFAVSSTRNVPFASTIPLDLYSTSGTPTVTLITCSGSWISSAHSYSTRLLLTATAVQ